MMGADSSAAMGDGRRDVQELYARYLLLLVGLLIMAVGVGFSIKANLGTSPISSVPYAVSLVAPVSVGVATIVMHCVFITLQILLLRRRYEVVQLMQLPVALVFGCMTDVAVGLLSGVSASTLLGQWALCAVGIVLVALGVSIEVTAGVVTLAGEGLVLAICKAFPRVRFASMKVGFDVTLVVIAICIGLVSVGTILGVGAGTVAAAICVGLVAKQFNKLLGRVVPW